MTKTEKQKFTSSSSQKENKTSRKNNLNVDNFQESHKEFTKKIINYY